MASVTEGRGTGIKGAGPVFHRYYLGMPFARLLYDR